MTRQPSSKTKVNDSKRGNEISLVVVLVREVRLPQCSDMALLEDGWKEGFPHVNHLSSQIFIHLTESDDSAVVSKRLRLEQTDG